MRLFIAGTMLIIALVGALLYFLSTDLMSRAQPVTGSLQQTVVPSANNVVAVRNEFESLAPFHVFIPTLPSGYAIATTVNSYTQGRAFYDIEASSGDQLVMVTQAPKDSAGAAHLYTVGTMRTEGSVTSTEIAGQTAYEGLEMGPGMSPMAVLLFTKGNIDIQLTTFDVQDEQVLADLANSME